MINHQREINYIYILSNIQQIYKINKNSIILYNSMCAYNILPDFQKCANKLYYRLE